MLKQNRNRIYILTIVYLVYSIILITLVSADQLLAQQLLSNSYTPPFIILSNGNIVSEQNITTGQFLDSNAEVFPLVNGSVSNTSWNNISTIVLYLKGNSPAGNKPINVRIQESLGQYPIPFSSLLYQTDVIYNSQNIGQYQLTFNPPLTIDPAATYLTIQLYEPYITSGSTTDIVYMHDTSRVFQNGYMMYGSGSQFGCPTDNFAYTGGCFMSPTGGFGINPYMDLTFEIYGNVYVPPPTPTPTQTGTPTPTITPTGTAPGIQPNVTISPPDYSNPPNNSNPNNPSNGEIANETRNWTNTFNGNGTGNGSSNNSILNQSGNTIRQITNSVRNITEQLNGYNNTQYKSMASLFILAISTIPAQVWTVFLLGWILTTVLLILKR